MPVVDGELNVLGIITRADMNEHRLHEYWHHQVRCWNPYYKIIHDV